MQRCRQRQLVRVDSGGVQTVELGDLGVDGCGIRLGGLGEAVEQLLRYPYGCAEQTSSSLLPWLVLRQSPWLLARPALFGMAPLLNRLIEVGLWAVAILWSLQELGYSVTAVLASLGLGGLAVALAAKNSLEHLIGGMTLSLDQPMRVGDQVKIGDVQGDVEQIGIRSTRIRTADRSLVSIPNGKLAELNIETLAARDRIRIGLNLNINPALKPSKLRELHEAVIACIKEQPHIIKDDVWCL